MECGIFWESTKMPTDLSGILKPSEDIKEHGEDKRVNIMLKKLTRQELVE